MTDVNIEVAISNDEPSVPLSDGNYWVEFSAIGIPLGISHYQRGPAGLHELVSQPTNLPDVTVQGQGQVYTDDPLTSSHGPEYTIPLRLKALDSDFQHLFSIDEKVNQYYNETQLTYLDNGVQKQITLYSPDDAASVIVANYSPGTYFWTTPTELSDFNDKYSQVVNDPDLEKRMSHYNLEWEDKNQDIIDALNNNNNLEMQQITWNVYDFSGGNRPKNLKNKFR